MFTFGPAFINTSVATPPDALLLSSIDELDPNAWLILSGDQQVTGTDEILLTGTY